MLIALSGRWAKGARRGDERGHRGKTRFGFLETAGSVVATRSPFIRSFAMYSSKREERDIFVSLRQLWKGHVIYKDLCENRDAFVLSSKQQKRSYGAEDGETAQNSTQFFRDSRVEFYRHSHFITHFYATRTDACIRDRTSHLSRGLRGFPKLTIAFYIIDEHRDYSDEYCHCERVRSK